MKLKLKASHRIVDDPNRIAMAEGRIQLLEAIAYPCVKNQPFSRSMAGPLYDLRDPAIPGN